MLPQDPIKPTKTEASEALADAIKDRTEVHVGSAKQVLNVAYKRVRDAFLKTVGAGGRGGLRAVPTRNELTLDSDAFAIKRKLGRSFFSRQLPRRTRAARLATLTSDERLLAKIKGWR